MDLLIEVKIGDYTERRIIKLTSSPPWNGRPKIILEKIFLIG